MSKMTKNSNNFDVFKISNWAQLERFLLLGAEGGTYYINQEDLLTQNTQALMSCLKEDGIRTVAVIEDVSKSGRSFKQNAPLFALAIASSVDDVKTRQAAFKALPKVARTASHLFTFVKYMSSFRGWGKAAKRAVQDWYLDKDIKSLSYQAIKYGQRDGWSHSDLLRLAHPKTNSVEHDVLFKYLVDGFEEVQNKSGLTNPTAYLNEQILAFEELKTLGHNQVGEAVDLIVKHRLPRECIPTHFKTNREVWIALVKDMPLGAMLTNLSHITRNGVLSDKESKNHILESLTNKEKLEYSRVHPMQVLLANKNYGAGHALKGSTSWDVDRSIMNALDKGFYLTYKNVIPTGKRHLLALDVSGSMDCQIFGTNITSREAVAALALVIMNTEPNTRLVGFQHNLVELNIKKTDTIEQVCNYVSRMPFGSTDCAAPFHWATDKHIEVDAFAVFTDNETGSGSYYGHKSFGPSSPAGALKTYRMATGIPAKLAVVATVPTDFTIADPSDAGMMDISGFDATVPQVLAEFFR